MRRKSAAIRSTILLIFLNNDNQVMNVTGISTGVEEMCAQSLRQKSIADVSVCHRQVRRICDDLVAKGFLETRLTRPRRSGRETIHYRLSEKDHIRARRTVAMLLEKSPIELFQSEYLHRVLDDIIARRASEIVQTELKADERTRMIDALQASPGALSRFLDPELEAKVHRVASIYNDGVPTTQTVIDYVEAATLIDVADAKWRP